MKQLLYSPGEPAGIGIDSILHISKLKFWEQINVNIVSIADRKLLESRSKLLNIRLEFKELRSLKEAKKNKIGVMQGRLLPKYKGRYQAHPVNYWQKEFEIAEDIGLDCIEFIFDFNDAKKNPLLTHQGIDEIKSVSDRTGVEVNTICADYFMDAPLHSKNPVVFARSVIPQTQDTNAILKIGSRPLGEILFNDPNIKRGHLEVGDFNNVWARRSTFTIGVTKLLVTEIFLETLYA